MKIKNLLILGIVCTSFSLGNQSAQAHGDTEVGSLPETSFEDPFASGTSYYGDPLSVGSGTVRSFVKVSEKGKPTDIGYIFDKAALTGLPESPVFPTASLRLFPPLPSEAPATAFEHIELIYWSNGHDPALSGIADLMHSHLDFTYFFISNEERDQICPTLNVDHPISPFVCTEEEIQSVLIPPPEGAIPEDFIQVPEFVTFYGLHRAGTAYFDPTDTLDPFEQTVFYGFNGGTLSYIDVPIANGFLEEFGEHGSGSFTRPIKQPVGGIYPTSDYYPTDYTLTYNEETEKYTMSLAVTFRSVPEHSSNLSLFFLIMMGVAAKLTQQTKNNQKAESVRPE